MATRRGRAATATKDEVQAQVVEAPASTALATTTSEYQGLSMVMSPDEAMARLTALQSFIAKVMVKGQDFGIIPGAGDKPTLLQPGAQKLAEVYGLAHRFEEVECIRDWDRMFFQFEYRTVLTSRRDGSYVGEGIGSCNSRESKYAYRWVFDDQVPLGVDKSKLEKQIRKSRKPGSFGKEYVQYKLPNQDLASVINTIQKMAAKRSYIHAVIAATRSSGIFTQDVEDLPASVLGRPEAEAEPKDEGGEGRPAQQEASTPAVLKLFGTLGSMIEAAETLEQLRTAWDQVNASKKKLDVRSIAELQKQKDARRELIEKASREEGKAQVEEAGDFPESMGGTAKTEKPKQKEPDDGEPPADVKTGPREREPGEEG